MYTYIKDIDWLNINIYYANLTSINSHILSTEDERTNK